MAYLSGGFVFTHGFHSAPPQPVHLVGRKAHTSSIFPLCFLCRWEITVSVCTLGPPSLYHHDVGDVGELGDQFMLTKTRPRLWPAWGFNRQPLEHNFNVEFLRFSNQMKGSSRPGSQFTERILAASRTLKNIHSGEFHFLPSTWIKRGQVEQSLSATLNPISRHCHILEPP